MVLVRLKGACLAFGNHVLLNKVDLDINAGERVCVLGRNGEGKSTLLKILNKQIKPDEGLVQHSDTVKIAALQQELPVTDPQTVYEVVASGLGELGTTISEYHEEILKGEHVDLVRLERLQHVIEANDGWLWQQKVDSILDRLDLPGDAPFDSMSGGWQRRVMLAQALVSEPDLLILDEPTNHMDIATIRWLEEQLLQFKGTLLFISHDRAFVQSLSTRIIELDRGSIYSWKGTYQGFLEHQEHRLAAEEVQNALFDKRLAEEEVWIRQGVKARRTRNEGRVERLKEMRNQRSQRRERQGNVSLSMNSADSSGKNVFELENVSFGFDIANGLRKEIVRDFTSVVMRGDRIGLVGPNGAGKSTVMKLLLEQIKPEAGTIKVGTKLDVAYFDQSRSLLDLEKSVAENVGDGKDEVEVDGRSRHILGYLQDFLFEPARARTPVKSLSGGERNRVLLAKLFLKPCNLLIMDEPTNDLDVETLELLEEKLVEYDATLLLVSHDRAFLDNVVTQLWVFDGKGNIDEQVGGYSDWEIREKETKAQLDAAVKSGSKKAKAPSQSKTTKAAPAVAKAKTAAKKLSYKLQCELDELPKKIEDLEAKQAELGAETGCADFYQKDNDYVTAKLAELQALEEQLEVLEGRWLELEEMAG
ncbi:ABC transporter ATP-binding protein [Oleispira antarctica]|uniref:ATP-binding protein Uup n=1 Tax=Oleispira antarctica TaxID=188908 RepID=A0A1Y5HPN6_OLEAN|nr:ABC transporter ATP-binding protein [Oleispira antarctica]